MELIITTTTQYCERQAIGESKSDHSKLDQNKWRPVWGRRAAGLGDGINASNEGINWVTKMHNQTKAWIKTKQQQNQFKTIKQN